MIIIRVIAVIAFSISITYLFPAAHADINTRVVISGPGTPVPDYSRAGAGVAIIHNGEAYLFDAGDGVVMRAMEAQATLGIGELEPTRIKYLFFTHLHSDHIHDYSVLASGRWLRRSGKLHACGPRGLKEFTDGMHKMMKVEADLRARGTPEDVISDPENYRVVVKEIQAGIILKKENLTEELIEKAEGVDLLIHEVASSKGLSGLSKSWQEYHNASHTTAQGLAEIASKSQPGILVLYHILFFGVSAEELLKEVKSIYKGNVILSRDLQVF